MIENFKTRYQNGLDELNLGILTKDGNLSNSEILRLQRIKEAWNFYEGYHWENIDPVDDAPQVTFNYCRAFVNKFVSFEFGNLFTINTNLALENTPVTVNDIKIEVVVDENKDGVQSEAEDKKIKISEKTLSEFLDGVWNYNDKENLCNEIGQTKSITGEAWVKVQFVPKEDLDDPYDEYPNGKIVLSVMPTQYVFPQYNQHNNKVFESILIQYPISKQVDKGILFKRNETKTVLYKELWTKDTVTIYEDKELISEEENPYGFIPFEQIKNFPVSGREHGLGDLDDIIPLNIELNTKKSDVSEIIDYHSAPITLVYGAKIGNLEKGANKVWGGLPVNSKVENLSLQGDLTASVSYTTQLRTEMCEIGGIPETVLGGASAISNTSGVALQYINLPLIERTRIKRHQTAEGIKNINKKIIMIAINEGLVTQPDWIPTREFIKNEVIVPDTLPKDELIELQKVQQELQLGLECRHGAMERLNKSDINNKIKEIDRERLEHPELFNVGLQQSWYDNQINSGMTNGETPIEQVRKEMTGQNGTPSVS